MSPSTAGAETVHGTVVALGEKAVLIRGPSGSGKSDLALRCIAAAPSPLVPVRAELIADDQVRLTASRDGIEAAPPPSIAGRIEVRGLGIMSVPHRSSARLLLVVDLAPAAEIPRYPLDTTTTDVLGFAVPTLRLAPFEATTHVKLLMALARSPDVLTPT